MGIKGKTIVGMSVAVVIFCAVLWGSYSVMEDLDRGVSRNWLLVENEMDCQISLIRQMTSLVDRHNMPELKETSVFYDALVQWALARTRAEQIESSLHLQDALDGMVYRSGTSPRLRSVQNYLTLVEEIAGMKYRLNVARALYNRTVEEYNRARSMFFTGAMARLLGFSPRIAI